ncbi:hypothetical protein AB1L42_08895 [Thalassoglobus sp. JC818]|uniref:hypothetical protein n=1 Tax=Thalassoglobus sp. JC818 TaxID=3232136 RepID=UPI00345AACBE
MIKVKRKVQFRDNRRGRRRQDSRDQIDVPSGRIPRISRLMALAIKFDGLITTGIITDQSELARLAHVTQPRMTQIMNLLNLAPDIQEELLFLPRVTSGRDPIHERMLRPMTAQASWKKQRKMWSELS